MTRLNWDSADQRFYEAGVDRGVLYSGVGSLGVPWNGLVNINEKPTGGKPTPLYLDGFKYLNYAAHPEFNFSIEAFTYPDEFERCEGIIETNGFGFTAQKREEFGLAYRTLVADEVEQLEYAYQIHLVYNAMVQPSSITHETLGDSTDPAIFSWEAETRPVVIPGVRPSAHLIIDSRLTHPSTLRNIEKALYGDEDGPAHLPTPSEIQEIFTTMITAYGQGPYGHTPYGGSS